MGNNSPRFDITEPPPLIEDGILSDSIVDMVEVQNWNDFYRERVEVMNILVLTAGILNKDRKFGDYDIQKNEPEELFRLYSDSIDINQFKGLGLAHAIYDIYFKKTTKERVYEAISKLIPNLIANRVQDRRRLFLSKCIPQGMTTLVEIVKCLDFLKTINYIDFLHTKDPYPSENDIEETIEKLLNTHCQYVNIISLCPDFFDDRRVLSNYISQDNFDYLKGRIFHMGPHLKSRNGFQDDTDTVIQIASDTMVHFESIMHSPRNFYQIEKGVFGDSQEYSQLGDDYDIGLNSDRNLMRILHRPDILCSTERLLRIKFSDFPFSVQPPFLQFLAYATLDDFKRVRNFLSRANTIAEKEARLRVFLATAEKKAPAKKGKAPMIPMGELILDLESQLAKSPSGNILAQKIFEQYSEIMSLAEHSASDIKSQFLQENSTLGFSEQTYVRELLRRANKQLRKYFEILSTNSQDSSEIKLVELEAMCNQCRVDMVQYGSLFCITENKDNYTLENLVKEVHVEGGEKKLGTAMTEQEYDIIRQLYAENYSMDHRWEQIKPLVEGMITSDKLHEEGKTVTYSIFYYQGEPLLTIRFSEDGDMVSAGAFNSPIHFQGYGFGTIVFRKMLEKYSGKDIHGTVIVGNEDLLKYYDQFGFKPIQEQGGGLKQVEKNGVLFYPIIKSGSNRI